MRRLFLFMIALLWSTTLLAQQQRLIVFGGTAWYPFDPLSGKYQRGSLAQLASYVDAWKQEYGGENVFVAKASNFERVMPDGYKAFKAMGDTVVYDGVMDYFGVGKGDISKFGIQKYECDTLRGGRILVIDLWDYFGDTTTQAKVVDISGYPVSADYMKSQDRSMEALKRRMATPIKVLDTVLSTIDQYFGPSHLGGLLHRFHLQATDADLSFAAIARPYMAWQKGDLYAKDIYRMFVYDNDLVVVEANGALVMEYLEKIYAVRYRTMRSPNDDLIQGKLPYFYHESLAGAPYWVNVSKSAWKRIENCEIDPRKNYKIAMSSFGTKWFTDKGCPMTAVGEYRLELLKWLLNADLSGVNAVEQWRIVPERWAADAAAREKQWMNMNVDN